MKRIFLITLFLLTTHSSQSMNSQKNNKPSLATELCLEGIENNNVEQVREALLAGADVNYTNDNGKSFFYLATHKNNNDARIIRELITHENIDLNNIQGKYKYTPLHAACEFGLSETVASMISKNSQATDARDHWGCTPLYIASMFQRKDCINVLLNHNISNINWQSYDHGDTVLHGVCGKKFYNCIKLLLEKNADTTIKNNDQLTPLAKLFSFNDDPFNDFITNEPLATNQLIHSTDSEYNNQLHLCTKLDTINYDNFEKYL
ncbi:MAG TPA: ankyrin repeat domain-containing protein, partial [Candidatus Babeliales bacterium]|nr:ankyrin repeat domain-containing protein [Candidatus Babeliales bacterium]